MRPLAILATVAALFGAPLSAQAEVVAHVDISEQRLTLIKDGTVMHEWPVSTARPGKVTPRGRYTAEFLSRYHKSSRYNNAPMPYSVFFKGHYAVHGTDQVGRLGRPASAGCIRLHPENAAILFALAKQVGLDKTVIEIVD